MFIDTIKFFIFLLFLFFVSQTNAQDEVFNGAGDAEVSEILNQILSAPCDCDAVYPIMVKVISNTDISSFN